MKKNIKTISIIGANGIMGALTGGLLAQNDFKVYFVSRTKEKSYNGLKHAINQARSDIIKKNVICIDYSELPNAIKDSDWIIECLSEDINVKSKYYELIEKYMDSNTIISTMTSSLFLEDLIEKRIELFKKNFMAVHLFNPPTKLLLCEIASTKYTSPEIITFIKKMLQEKLHRIVIISKNIPTFIGNRIGFMFLSEISRYAEDMGIGLIDYLIGPYTGRALSPFATLDLVGLDTHKSIINNLRALSNDYMHDSFVLPGYIDKMIVKGHLGNKTPNKGGFYRQDIQKNRIILDIVKFEYNKCNFGNIAFVEKAKSLISTGNYKEAFQEIMNNNNNEANFVKKMLCKYISYSFFCINEVLKDKFTIEEIDKAMAYGFNWAPPSFFFYLFGSKESIIDMLEQFSIKIPKTLYDYEFNKNRKYLNYYKFLIAK